MTADARDRRNSKMCIVTHDDLADTFPKLWARLPRWFITAHTPDEIHELIASLYFALPDRLVRRAERELSQGNPAAAQRILAMVLPRLLDEPCDDGDDPLTRLSGSHDPR